jgi:hypothetical protein
VADHFPESIEYEAPDFEPGEAPDPDDPPVSRLRLKAGASMPEAEHIRGTLGLQPEEPVDASNPEQLVPLARRTIARQRQSMLATMVLGFACTAVGNVGGSTRSPMPSPGAFPTIFRLRFLSEGNLPVILSL